MSSVAATPEGGPSTHNALMFHYASPPMTLSDLLIGSSFAFNAPTSLPLPRPVGSGSDSLVVLKPPVP